MDRRATLSCTAADLAHQQFVGADERERRPRRELDPGLGDMLAYILAFVRSETPAGS